MKKKWVLLLSVLCLNFFSCQDYSYKYQAPPANLSQDPSFVTVNTDKAVDVTRMLSRYRSNSNFDYTAAIQSYLDKFGKIILPPWAMYINDTGISMPSGSRLYFKKGSALMMLPSAKTHFDMIKIYDAADVRIYNAVLVGDRKKHLGKGGEWAAGIGIRNASDVVIKYAKIKDTWGDGIFVGSESGGVSTNISITNVDIDNARRNGVSVTSGSNVLLEKFLISNTNGTAPMCGVDIEPSLPQEYLSGITLRNITTFNNENGGMNVNTSVLNDAIPRKVTINIVNHTDYQSAIAFGYSINANNQSGEKISGEVSYTDAVWHSPRRMPYWKTPNPKSINVKFRNVKVNSGSDKSVLNDENF